MKSKTLYLFTLYVRGNILNAQFDKLKFGSCFSDDKIIFLVTKPFAPKK